MTTIGDLLSNGWTYFQGWINGYGYYYWTPPWIVSLLFLLSLVAAFVSDRTRDRLQARDRLVLVLIFLAGYLATVASLYLTFTPVGAEQVLGVQGRYFVPLGFLLFLALTGISWKAATSISSRWIIVFLSMALLFNLLAIFLSFHVLCGNTFYESRLCYRPLFKDFPSDTHLSPPLSSSTRLEQEFQAGCKGMTEVRVLLHSSTASNGGSTRFVLEEAESKKLLLDQAIADDRIRREDWYSLRFEPDWNSEGKQYRLRILGMEAPAEQGPQAFYTTQPEFDLGNLYENGQPLPEDLVLQYGCVAGLRKIWLTGKP
jgi:hypothetical protein